jgi:ribose transport system ATP-binding protein
MDDNKDKSILKMQGITKRFGAVTALEQVDFDLSAGEIHSIVGENGAGKSTLVKIISGAIADYEGKLFLRGQAIRFRNPRDAKKHGVGIVYQELSTINSLSVAENIFIERHPVNHAGLVDWKKMREDARSSLADFGFIDIDVEKRLDDFGFAIKQVIEIIKVLKLGAQIIILDEPTSGISKEEIATLFQVVRKLKQEGKSVIYISHHLDEVLNISDRITILRDGKSVDVCTAKDCDKRTLIQKILGEELTGFAVREEGASVELEHREKLEDLTPVLRTETLAVPGRFESVSFEVRHGEALGLYGLVGSGYSEVGQCLFGLFPKYTGKVYIDDREVRIKSPSIAKQSGIGYLPEDRTTALVHSEPIYKNITLPYMVELFEKFLFGFVLRKGIEFSAAEKQIDNLRVKAAGPNAAVNSLSGGNIQKVSLGKWLTFVPKVYILTEPTRGVDVGARAEILSFINHIKQQENLGLIVISTEPDTIMELSDRILVFSKGRAVAEFGGEKVNESILLEAAS